jgi:predicted enzyme related to lactoylglutathione lyase
MGGFGSRRRSKGGDWSKPSPHLGLWQGRTMQGRENSDESVDRDQRRDWWGVVLEAPDARELADFYAAMLGWHLTKAEEDYCALTSDNGIAYLAVQTADNYVRPTWPVVEGQQQITSHLDFEVSDLSAAVADAIRHGAVEAAYQPQTDVRVMVDPAGHPFCLWAASGTA